MARTKSQRGQASRPGAQARRGRPARAPSRERKQLVIDMTLLKKAMGVTGRNQSDTVNEALARMTENVAIIEGLEQLCGAFPEHPDHVARGA